MRDEALEIFGEKIEAQRLFLEHWRQPCEPLLFETLRSIDNVFCEELFLPPDAESMLSRQRRTISSWGVNKALSLMVPPELPGGPFRLFPSYDQTRQQATEFLFQAGVLQRVEMLYGWLDEGLLSARLDKPPSRLDSGIDTILVLKTDHPSMFCEVVSQKHKRWVSDLTIEHDAPWEQEVQRRHVALEAQFEAAVQRSRGWGIAYTTTDEIDDHFTECGQIYLRRMWSQDLIGMDDVIGGEPFNHYLGILAAIAGRAQKHLCFASILKRRHPELDLRNLLTTFAPCDEFAAGLAAHIDADTGQVRRLLECLTLGPSNLAAHTDSAETAWAPIVRSSRDYFILPLYGLEINPFLFLLSDLRARFPEDWFRVANNREKRWLQDLRHIFPGNRWVLNDRNLKLRDGGRTVTDLDFIAYDARNNELALFQLKWQHPVGLDNRARRSAGKNLLSQGNDWVKRVVGWLDKFGAHELAKRAGIEVKADVKVELFVIGRYSAYFAGFADRDPQATWADWNHLMKVRYENPNASVSEIATTLRKEADRLSNSYPGDSYAIPIDNLAVILNPSTEPKP